MLEWIHGMLWGPGTLVLFLGVGLLYSIHIRGFALFGVRRWWKTTVGGLFRVDTDRGREGISQFQSACTALAATIGTGNIAGVATAILAGGPGAVFWMWVSAFLGMATAYGETELGIRYRVRDGDGNWRSGPMLYLERGLKCRWAGMVYACFCVAASFGMGSMVQANAITETFEAAFSLPPAVIGILLSAACCRIIAGGVESIAKTAEKMVPISAGIYLAASAAVIMIYCDNLPAAFRAIFKDACSFSGIAGGAAGFGVSRCVRYGVARGVFSNEAGLGSLAVLNGAVEESRDCVQGQWAIFEVFFDTIVSCTLTAVVILCAAGDRLDQFSGNGAALITGCFSAGLGDLGGYLVSLCTALFAFATILAWYYMGRQSALYLGDACGLDLRFIYMAGYLTAVFLGSLGPMETVWKISDIFNGLMAVPNLLALVVLVREVRRPGRVK